MYTYTYIQTCACIHTKIIYNVCFVHSYIFAQLFEQTYVSCRISKRLGSFTLHTSVYLQRHTITITKGQSQGEKVINYSDLIFHPYSEFAIMSRVAFSFLTQDAIRVAWHSSPVTLIWTRFSAFSCLSWLNIFKDGTSVGLQNVVQCGFALVFPHD